MSLILSFETSTNGCSAALHESGKLVSNFELFAERSSAEMLTTLIAQTLKVALKTFEDLDAIAVSKGPGSYTGLRIGVSTAKGICFASDLPLISVNSLDTMYSHTFEGLLCPMLDARRMEVYCKIVNKEGEVVLPTAAVVIDESSFQSLLDKNKILFCGEGALKCKSMINHPNAHFIGNEIRPKAANMGMLAFEKFKTSEFEDVAEFEPYYLKEFVSTTPLKSKKVTA
jgi:tRNA threonylcarbamoyladenosine biosynthesis protein TsaB